MVVMVVRWWMIGRGRWCLGLQAIVDKRRVRKVVAEPMRVKPSQEPTPLFSAAAQSALHACRDNSCLQPACLPSSSECKELVTRDNDREVGCMKVVEKSVAEQQEKGKKSMADSGLDRPARKIRWVRWSQVISERQGMASGGVLPFVHRKQGIRWARGMPNL
jgi:hypothetical protein